MSSRTDPPVLVGTVVRAHGLRGEVVIFPHTDSKNRFGNGQVVRLSDGRSLTIAATRPHEQGFLVRFEEIGDRNDAEALGKVDLFIPASERRTLREDEYWPDDLIGLEVHDEAGAILGRVIDVDDASVQARLLIETPAGTRLVPLVTEMVPYISLTEGIVVVTPVPGLLD